MFLPAARLSVPAEVKVLKVLNEPVDETLTVVEEVPVETVTVFAAASGLAALSAMV